MRMSFPGLFLQPAYQPSNYACFNSFKISFFVFEKS